MVVADADDRSFDRDAERDFDRDVDRDDGERDIDRGFGRTFTPGQNARFGRAHCGPKFDRGRHLGHPGRHDMGLHRGCPTRFGLFGTLPPRQFQAFPNAQNGQFETALSGIVVSTNLNAGEFTLLSGLQSTTVQISQGTSVERGNVPVDLFSIRPFERVTVFGFRSGGVLVAELVRIG